MKIVLAKSKSNSSSVKETIFDEIFVFPNGYMKVYYSLFVYVIQITLRIKFLGGTYITKEKPLLTYK